jgi:hypothetical protein
MADFIGGDGHLSEYLDDPPREKKGRAALWAQILSS